MPTADARKLLDGKTSVASGLRTAEWARVPQWLRERAFYMAGVSRAEILDTFRNAAGRIANGESSMAEERKRIDRYLADTNYQPLPGQEGTIKDLRTVRRIHTALRTNVSLLQGWGQKERGLRSIIAVPAWELVRFENRAVPRVWAERFHAVGGDLIDGLIIALKDSEVWRALGSRAHFDDALGVDYPPFAWGSGMGWRGVPYARAKELGLLDNWTPPEPRPLSSPNESLESSPAIASQELRDQLSEHLQGLAEWQGDTLIFTDPNGTRPLAAPQLIAAWDRGMPEKFQDLPGKGLISRHALGLWAKNQDAFTRELDPETNRDLKPAPGRLNLFDDLWRLITRLPAMPENTPLFRGLSWDDAPAFDAFLTKIEKSGQYIPLANKPADSWTYTAASARARARSQAYGITLICEGHSSAKDLSALLQSIAADVQDLETDGRVVFARGAKFEVLRIERKPEGATVHVRQI